MPRKAQFYIGAIAALAAIAVIHGFVVGPASFGRLFAVCCAAAALLSPCKLRLPGVTGTYSPGFLPVLWAIANLSLPEGFVIAAVVGVAQTCINTRQRPTWQQVVFNAANLVLTVCACRAALAPMDASAMPATHPAVMAFTAALYFVFNTGVVSGILALLSGKSLREVASGWYTWSLPYHLIGSAALTLVPAGAHTVRWEGAIAVLALLLLVQFYSSLSSVGEQPGQVRSRTAARLAATLYVGAVIAGFCVLLAVLFQMPDWQRLLVWTLITAFASSRKVPVPGMDASLSPSFIVLLVAIAELPLAEVVLLAMVSAAVQCVWFPARRPRLEQVLFSVAALGLSASLSYVVSRMVTGTGTPLLAALTVSSVILYLANTLLVSIVIWLLSGELMQVWQRCHFWVFAYYLVGAVAAGLIVTTGRTLGWAPAMLGIPAAYLVFVSYRLQVTAWMAASAARSSAAQV